MIQGLADSRRQERTDGCCSGRIVGLLSIRGHCLVPLSLYLSVCISQSPLILACRKYFIPTHAVNTQTQAMIPVRMMSAG